MKVPLLSLEGEETGNTVSVPMHIFGLEPRKDILHRMVVYQLAKRQRGTHFSKTRAHVCRTGKKFVRQKGTGGARHGSRRVNIFRGGGKAFGPVVRSHAIALPKKFRALALRHALSAKCRAGSLAIVPDISFEKVSTAQAHKLYTQCTTGVTAKRQEPLCLFIGGPQLDEKFSLSSGNLSQFMTLPYAGLNVYDVLKCDRLILSQAALDCLQEKFVSQESQEHSERSA